MEERKQGDVVKRKDLLQVFHEGIEEVEVKNLAKVEFGIPKTRPVFFENVNVPPEIAIFLRENFEKINRSVSVLLKALSATGAAWEFCEMADGEGTVTVSSLNNLSVEEFRNAFQRALDSIHNE